MYKLKDGKKQTKKPDEYQYSLKFCCITSTILKLRSTLAAISSPQYCFTCSLTTKIRARPTGIQSDNQCAEMNFFPQLSLSLWGRTCVVKATAGYTRAADPFTQVGNTKQDSPKKISLSIQDDIIANQL